ncbi:hypothetical protein AHF37_12607, partial [Paragonimus kellicotti]
WVARIGFTSVSNQIIVDEGQRLESFVSQRLDATCVFICVNLRWIFSEYLTFLDNGLEETPLGCAASQQPSRELILKLVEKGAHLEFRDTDTLTPIHRAAMTGNLDAIKDEMTVV